MVSSRSLNSTNLDRRGVSLRHSCVVTSQVAPCPDDCVKSSVAGGAIPLASGRTKSYLDGGIRALFESVEIAHGSAIQRSAAGDRTSRLKSIRHWWFAETSYQIPHLLEIRSHQCTEKLVSNGTPYEAD